MFRTPYIAALICLGQGSALVFPETAAGQQTQARQDQARSVSGGKTAPPIEAARQVLAAVVLTAEQNQKQKQTARPADRLTELYVRAAAKAALALADKQADAFLLAVGVALDDDELLRKNLVTRDLWARLETDAERRKRLAVLGSPTIHGRHDWAQHFAVSAALTVFSGRQAAEAAGVFKEQLDMRPGGSGFSFADLGADFAGIAFAEHVRGGASLAELSKTFTVVDYVPKLAGLADGLPRDEFARQYGSVSDERFRAAQAAVWKRVRDLPVYQK